MLVPDSLVTKRPISFARDTAQLDLKAATRGAHLRLESRIDIAARIADPVAYRTLLAGLWGFHAGLEPQLAVFDWAAAGIDLAPRLRQGDLEADLDRLGIDAAARAELPRIAETALPRLGSHAAAFGCLYVLEGSTLGGRVISRMIAASLGYGRTSGAGYYAGYGERTGVMWQTFVAALNAALLAADHRAAAQTAALATFDMLGDWLSVHARR